MSTTMIIVLIVLAIILIAAIYFGIKIARNWDNYSKMLKLYQNMNTQKKQEKKKFTHGIGDKHDNRKKRKKR